MEDVLLFKSLMTKIQLIKNKTGKTIIDSSEEFNKTLKNGCKIVSELTI